MKIWVEKEQFSGWVHAQKIGGKLWIHFNGKTFAYEKEDNSKKRKGQTDSKLTGDINAPMPGKITKILKRVGERVEKGEVVVIMEAMKMEYSLKAQQPAKIAEIFCSVGSQVELGKKLIKLDEAP